MKPIVVALGGNAILKPEEHGTCEEQLAAVGAACAAMADLAAQGRRLVITHGNGPQVGNILIQQEEARSVVPPMPLDICGAQSQGFIGYIIQRSMDNELRRRGIERRVVSLVTQVLVDPEDPAFRKPDKPIGPFYTPARAKALTESRGYRMKEDVRGWRRVVPSPEPLAIVESEAIRLLVEQGMIIVACGGGGIPVVRRPGGRFEGVEAVIDKDRAAQRLATEVGAEGLMILTNIERVALRYGQPSQTDLETVTLAEGRRYQAEGHFPGGTMGPKVEACLGFIEAGGPVAMIGPLQRAAEVLSGAAGTRFIP